MSSVTTYLFRRLPKTFSHAIKPHGSKAIIDVARASQQHKNFQRLVIHAAKDHGDSSIVFPEAEHFADSCFIEDTCVSLRPGIAVSVTPSAPSRSGESGLIRPFLDAAQMNGELEHVYHMGGSEKCDGGDVLVIGKHVFIGASQRTQSSAHCRWRNICMRHDLKCIPVPVTDSLHLKSFVTWLHDDFGLVAQRSKEGVNAAAIITSALNLERKQVHFVDRGANMLRIHNTVLHEPGLVFCRHPKITFVECDMSELNKAGGALTCGVVALQMTQ